MHEHIAFLKSYPDQTAITSESWQHDSLEAVLQSGLDVLSDVALAKLATAPVALFVLHEAIEEAMPDQWLGPVLDNARQLTKKHGVSRPLG